MSKTDFILTRSGHSPAVRRVLAASIQYVLRKHVDVRIAGPEADLLARTHTPATVIGPYRKQLAIERGGVAEGSAITVAGWNVASDGLRERSLHLRPEDRNHLKGELDAAMSEAIERSKRHLAQSQYRQRVEAEIIELGRRVEAAGPQFRYFVRRVDRLWSKQVLELRTFIESDSRRDAAICELAELYKSAFKAAIGKDVA